LADEPNVNPDAVAFHFQQSGDARAWEWYARAGERAQRAYAWLTANERLGAAAALLEGVRGEEEKRARLLYRCGRLQRYSNTTEGTANLAVAERLASGAGNRVLAADARYSRGLLRCFADDFGLGLEEMEGGIIDLEQLPAREAESSWGRAIWMADALPPRDLADIPDIDPAAQVLIEAHTHHRRGGLPWFLAAAGYLARAQPMAEEFISRADGVLGGLLVISATGHSHFGLGIAQAAQGRPEQAQVAFSRAREIYRVIDHHAVIGFTLLTELQDVVLPYYTMRIQERRQMAAAAETALELAAGAFQSDRLTRRARLSLLFLEGKWDEACAIADEVETHGNYVLRREVTNAIAPIWYWQGRADLVQDQIRQLLPQGPTSEPGGVVLLDGLLLQRLGADVALDRGDLAAALAWIEANDRWLEWSGAVRGRAENRLCWAQYCRAAGDVSSAARYIDAAIELASSPEQPLALIAAHRLRGEPGMESGNLELAEIDLNRSLMLAESCEAPFEQALTLVARAELRLATGRVDDAQIDLADARSVLLPLRAQRVLDRVDAIAARFVSSDAVAPGGLSPRELEVLRLVAQGMTDADVASRLFISPRTVSQHLRSIYGKLDISSRVAATRFAVDHDLT